MLYAYRARPNLLPGETRQHRNRPLPHRRRHDLHRRRPLHRHHDRRNRRRNRHHPRSPNAAKPAPTTKPPKPPWKTAKKPDTSKHGRFAFPTAHARVRPAAGRRRPAMTLDLLRFTTAGSVDDGKSTLIGRLLYDSKQVFEDQLEHVTEVSRQRGNSEIDLALLTDGLRAEREQGITIDVAYRYFTTPRRRFIIADCPGHQQYTRNMVTGASTADLAVILLDARKGVLRAVQAPRLHQRAARHPPHRGRRQQDGPRRVLAGALRRDRRRLRAVRSRSCGVEDWLNIPISALRGDNVVDPSERMPWYGGPTLLAHLETGRGLLRPSLRRAGALPGAVGRPDRRQRRRVPRLRRPARERGAARRRGGRRAAVGGQRTRIAAIDTYEGELDEAIAPLSADAAPRGRPRRRPRRADRRPDRAAAGHARVRGGHLLDGRASRCAPAAAYTSSTRLADRDRDRQRADRPRRRRHARARVPPDELELNDIGRVSVRTSAPLAIDPYRAQPPHRQLHADRRDDQRHRRRGHDRRS